MPVAAVAGALYAGTTIATVGVAAMTTFEIIAAVGAIASGIGAVTGNEDLMKIGGIASLAGGVGMFAQGQGWIGGSIGNEGNIAAMKGTTAPGVESVAPVIDNGSQATVDFGQAAGNNSIELSTAGLEQAGNTAKAIQQPSGLIDAPSVVQPATAQPAGLIDATVNKPTNPTDLRLAAGSQTSPQTSGGSILDSFKSFTDIFKDKDGRYNKDLLSMAGNFVGGMFDEKKEAETAYLKSRTNELNSQMRNANAIPDMSGFKFTPRDIFPKKTPTFSGTRVGLIGA
jgi:hypothetical protein